MTGGTQDAGAATGSPAAPGGGAAGFRPGATLPLRVEAARQLRRRRTLVVAAVLVLLPPVLLLAFAVGGTPADRGSATFMQTATASGLNFATMVVFVSSGFLLAVPPALFCGDTVAAEAGWASLRYLLAAPVPRGRLLTAKLAVALAFGAVATLLLPLVALAAGTCAYGWHDLALPGGGTLPAGAAVQRLLLAAVYVFVSNLSLAAVAFWLSTVTDAPLGAVGGAVGVAILGNVLDAVTALGGVRQVLPTHWQYAWLDAFRTPAGWDGMLRGTAVSVAYALVFTALAFRHFRRKDVVS